MEQSLLWSAVRAVEVSVAGIGSGLLRLMLLALLSIGVIEMHTVGHAGDHGSFDMSGHAVSATMPEAAMAGAADAAAWLTNAVELCDGDCGTATPVAARSGSGSDPLHGGTGLVVMCMAVLAGLSILALLAGFLARRHRSGAASAAPPCSTHSPRAGPAKAFMFAARLVDVAVLRI